MQDDPGDEDGGEDEDGRIQALVERIQAAYEGAPNDLIIAALIEELCEVLLRAPRALRVEGMERTVEMIRKYVTEAE